MGGQPLAALTIRRLSSPASSFRAHHSAFRTDLMAVFSWSGLAVSCKIVAVFRCVDGLRGANGTSAWLAASEPLSENLTHVTEECESCFGLGVKLMYDGHNEPQPATELRVIAKVPAECQRRPLQHEED